MGTALIVEAFRKEIQPGPEAWTSDGSDASGL